MAMMLDSSCAGGEYGGAEMLLSLETAHDKSVPAPFLTKTYHLVDDMATDHIVSWGEDEATFVVWRPPEFARDLLPNYFKHNNFSSFVRQLNTYGFRKIVPDRWEFANEFFRKGEKHLLCRIHRRKAAQPQVALNHHHHHHPHSSLGLNPGPFFPFPAAARLSLSPNSDSDNDHFTWPCDDCPTPPPHHLLTPPSSAAAAAVMSSPPSSLAALSEDNERLRRSNNMLMSELAHMRKLYNDIIYFVQNHVKPVPPRAAASTSSLMFPTSSQPSSKASMAANPLYNPGGPYHHHQHPYMNPNYSKVQSPQSCVTIVEEEEDEPNVLQTSVTKTRLFGVPIHSKKRLHPENPNSMDHKARFLTALEKDGLGLNLMPPSSSTC
ncbi:hypothetical protein SAY87_031521 [Trapa incisa]|uniref:HSF-type DNA-binding domain-containing protein n=1 Tax=Trapa incisa TaxID=236973 RepID=A0AAN7QL90_9MYRT|nr:hypothetical protein SAY87_031521 [Trapa incisa]